jgi:hypothetical protein
MIAMSKTQWCFEPRRGLGDGYAVTGVSQTPGCLVPPINRLCADRVMRSGLNGFAKALQMSSL